MCVKQCKEWKLMNNNKEKALVSVAYVTQCHIIIIFISGVDREHIDVSVVFTIWAFTDEYNKCYMYTFFDLCLSSLLCRLPILPSDILIFFPSVQIL